MHAPDPIDASGDVRRDARRELEICNACRYCEGFCAVFPAMMMRRAFGDGDVAYLANLCHDCKGCFHACQYAPPHPFGVNLPQTLAKVRRESYEHYAWPAPLARLFHRNGVVVCTVSTLAVALAVLLTGWLRGGALLTTARSGPGAFYAVIPSEIMIAVAGAVCAYALAALIAGGTRFWRDTGGGSPVEAAPARAALGDILTLRNLGGGHGGADGCNDTGENFSQWRRCFHQVLFYGFLLCFASTSVAAFDEHVMGLQAPYPVLSWPVLLGIFGGIGMLAGPAGLIGIKLVTDPAPVAKSLLGADYALLGLLLAIAADGLLLLALRDGPAMGVLLAVHLGLVISFFLLIPYSKMVHGLYRSLALLRNAIERRKVKEPAEA
jgi:citrate/tricarballylate utilization protein